MTDLLNKKPPVWFWIVTVIGLIWNAMGVMQYLGQAYSTDSFKSQYTEEQLNIILNTPAWATAAFAIAVFSGLLGCVFLLLRKRIAYALLLISLIGVIVQMYHNLFVVNSIDIYGPAAVVMTGMILVLGLFLLWFSKHSIKKGWIK